ncbi:MAG TPA: helix-turn-helix transcriptional regulator [Micromonosporaceae bacterium]
MPVTGQRVVRRALGRRLTRLRTAAGMTRREVADARLGMSEPTLHRIETGKVPVTVANVRALCWLYRADSSMTDALAELALGTSEEQWWDASPLVPDWFKLYVGLEASAVRLSSYDGEIVPGEWQTEAYARAIFATEQTTDPDSADRHIKLRLQRQKALLNRRPPPQIVAILGQGALTRPVGGVEVLRQQIAHLCDLSHRKNVDIRVLPWSIGSHAAMAGAFRIMEFDDPEDPDVVYLESHVGALYLEELDEIKEYQRIFSLIVRDSVPIDDIQLD